MHLHIFDLDGTLIPYDYGQDNSFMSALSKLVNVSADYPYWLDCEHRTDHYVFHHIYSTITKRAPSATELTLMQDHFIGELSERRASNPEWFAPVPGSVEFIELLAKHPNHTAAIATGSWKRLAKYKLDGVAACYNTLPIIGSDEEPTKLGFTKKLITQLQSETNHVESITYYGDSLYDAGVSEELGLAFIGIDINNSGVLQQAGIRNTYKDFNEFIASRGDSLSLR